MEKIGRQVFLYDFYGELLTDHQKSVYEDIVLNDLSLSEIAQERGISRQGVHDLVKRCDRILSSYEEKLHLVERFIRTRDDVTRIWELSDSCAGSRDDSDSNTEDEGLLFSQDPEAGRSIPENSRSSADIMQEIHCIAGQILEEL